MQVLQMDVHNTCTVVKDHSYASIADGCTQHLHSGQKLCLCKYCRWMYTTPAQWLETMLMQVLQMDVHYTCTVVKDHAYASIADAYTNAQLWKTMLMQVLQMDVGYTCTLVKDHAYASIADAYTPVQW